MTGTARLKRKYGHEALTLRNMDSCIVRLTLADAVKKAIRQWQKEMPGGLVLDVGCGSQPYRPWIEHAGMRYAGVDWQHSIHDIPPGQTRFCDLSSFPWPLEAESHDAILCTEVLEHQFEPLAFLCECRRVLRPGGSALITTPFVWPEHETPHDYYRYTRFALKRLLEDAGFDILTIDARGGWHTTMAQALGLWACFGFRKPLNYLSRVAAWPLIQILRMLDRRQAPESGLPVTLGYSAFIRRRS